MKEEYGVFFGMCKPTKKELKDLETKIVTITPEIENLEIVKFVKELQIKLNGEVRVELIKII
mgnify:CR=1 FL=1|tara:strand:- start:3351 stop:3536 length:186 start_codon:yes stop_codon:yes gene_type:complete